MLCTVVDKHVLLIRLSHLLLPRPKRGQPIGKHLICCLGFPALPLGVLRSLSSSPFTFYSVNSSPPRIPSCPYPHVYYRFQGPWVNSPASSSPSLRPPLLDVASAFLSLQRASLGSTAASFLWDAGQLTAREWSSTQPSAVGW